ncbi:putative tetraspanin tsp3 [Diplodia seriata]|uniref:Putative tetraspanin tsp3 n=1 Tax=Diplodia seriata TaxID=420778 RepID=A0A0G2EYG0_9PEZI|nr:putative tetraspanin tsp3 [Diplodia seriata]
MMAINKSGIASVATGILFLGLTAVAWQAYAHYAIQHLALPIPAALSFLVIVLPVAQALSTWYLTRAPAAARGSLALPVSSPQRDATVSTNATPAPRINTILLSTLTILTAVLATLSGTHTTPGPSLDCALREQWQALYRAKDGEQLRTIQDALRCCGFRSVYDMAWPFAKQEGGRTQRSTCAATLDGRVRYLGFTEWIKLLKIVS